MSLLENFVINHIFWAYAILFGGMFIEGEVFILTAMIFARQGLMEVWLIALLSFIGVILGDLTWYALGRWSKESFIGKWLQQKFSTYHKWMDENFMPRYQRMVFLSKFLYYVNRLTPLIAGWHKLDVRKFFKIHLLAGIFWVVIMMIVGHFLGLVIDVLGVKAVIKNMEFIFIGLAVIFIGGEILLKKIFIKKIK